MSTDHTMKAVITAPHGCLELAEVSRPTPRPGEMLLRVEYAGLCGSDLHGSELYPVGTILGHEFVGIVAGVGQDVRSFGLGDRVCSVPAIGCGACLQCLGGDPVHCSAGRILERGAGGAFAEYVIVGESSSVPVPSGVDPRLAALTEPLAVGLKIIDAADLAGDDAVLVVGGGTVGQAVTLWAAAKGIAQVVLSDPHESHRSVGMQLGATAVLDPRAPGFEDAVERAFGRAPTVVIDCVGRPGILSQSTRLAAPHGRLILAGLHLGDEVFQRLVPLQKELSILFPNFSTVRGFDYALAMLGSGRIDPTPLLGPQVSLAELPEMFARLKVENRLGKVLVAVPSGDGDAESFTSRD